MTDLSLLSSLFKEKDFIEERLKKIQEYFNYRKTTELVYFYSNKDLSAYLGTPIPEWVKGVGSSDNKILLVANEGWETTSQSSLGQILIHEFVHIAIENTFKGECPLWLNEGLALYLAGQTRGMDFSQCKKDYDYYKASYSDPFFYTQCGYIVSQMMKKNKEEKIIEQMKNCRDFKEDSYLGKKVLKYI